MPAIGITGGISTGKTTFVNCLRDLLQEAKFFDADAMARRLSSKGYSAFVLPLAETTPTRYRVRVGKFQTKREAEAVAAKLQKEEQFKPWITR